MVASRPVPPAAINVQVGCDIHAALAGLLDMLPNISHQCAPAGLISDLEMEDLGRESSAYADGDCFVHGIDNLAALAADMACVDAAVFSAALATR